MSAPRNIRKAASDMLSTPSAKAFIDQHRHTPDSQAMLMIDTGDGRPGSDEDHRCDGCGIVQPGGIGLAFNHLRVTADGLQMFESASLINPGPVVMLVFGICGTCSAELGAAA